ncbi:MAG: glycoside hydrolase family 3 C-terminal domain-containing protein [Oscillospiraceae bacterium]|nr:glycoside hydrolase family 3 C-terminal domain-containing protein [Oscillospiraceae bacterium]
MKKKGNGIALWSILSGVMAVLLAASIVGGNIANLNRTAINEFLGLDSFRTVGSSSEDIFKSDFAYTRDGEVSDANSLWNVSVEAANRAVEEGTVILWNHDNALPLANGSGVSLFSRSSVDPRYSGQGSGLANTANAVSLVDAMKNAGFSVNDSLVEFYKGQPARDLSAPFNRNEAAWSSVSDQSFSGYSDAAIFTITTMGTEEGDLVREGSDTVSGDNLDLSRAEKDAIEGLISLKKGGTFKKVVLLINTCATINFRAIEPYMDDIDACVWVGQPGGVGFTATAEILAGKRNPSGHLPDTYTYDASSIPAVQAYGDNTFGGDISLLNEHQSHYIVYNEGIYVGYRYFETRYEDLVLGNSSAASDKGATSGTGWNYASEVAFPFGYGLSYTTFEYSDFAVSEEAGSYAITLTVKNTGSVDGKDAVQIYLQKPYTEYDKENGVEKSSVELAGFAKTPIIKAGESAGVRITVDKSQLASYDANGAKTYVLEAGTYYLTAAEDSHAAINNILAAKGKTVADGMDADGSAALAYEFIVEADDFTTYSVSKSGGTVENQFDHADWNKTGYSDEKITYLSRSDWEATFPAPVQLKATSELIAALAYDKAYDEDPAAVTPTYGAEKKYSLFEMTDVAYDDPKWAEFMNQITLEETSELLASAYKNTAKIDSLDKPGTKETDGPLGQGSNWTASKHAPMSFPTAPTVAATFNDELLLEIGALKGESMLHAGYNGLYGTACGIHRTPYSGRNYEYYSEDPFLSAVSETKETVGIQTKGGYVMIKHLVMNDQEINRKGVATFANEQAIREIYLEPFRMAVEDGSALGVMSAFNRVGALWCGGDRYLLTNVLRGEWGFEGVVISDCPVVEYMSFIDGVLAGNDIWLYGNPVDSFIKYKDSPTATAAMRQAAMRINYMVSRSSAMNGVDANTELEIVTNWWQYLVTDLQIVFGVLLAGSIVMLLRAIRRKKKA